MDLYSTARRLGRPVIVTAEVRQSDLPISAHALIGDGFTAGLVRVDGVIDWLCFPRFDSPSVFGALLDKDRGGYCAVHPVSRPFESLQQYDPDTNVLETLMTVPGQGTIRLIDYMPWSDDPRSTIHELHRRVECVEGKVEVEFVFDPRFNYGKDEATFEVTQHGVLARGAGNEQLVAVVDNASPWSRDSHGAMTTRATLSPGQRRWMVLSWDADTPEPLGAYRPYDHLRSTRHNWRVWSSRLQYDGPWRHHVLRSALCLKLLMYAPTGAMVAAPTTSLPEWIGGVRNWDYRYTWPRDAAMAIRAANLLGFGSEAKNFFHFLRDTIDPSGHLRVMYTVDGKHVPSEAELSHLSGFRGSTPVRIGNDARDQLQLDIVGAVVDTAHLYEHFGGSLSLRTWRKLRRVIESAERDWTKPDHGLWEPRDGTRHNVHSKAMCWLALDRGAGIAARFRSESLRERWLDGAERIRDDLLASGLDPTSSHFVAAYGENRTDAALLVLPMLRILPDEHPFLTNTIDRVRAELGTGSFVHRYKNEDGVGGPEGSFLLCGFWLVEALALTGRLDEALEVFAAHTQASNHAGLLSEEINPTTGELLGNFPQAFSHLGLINAAFRLDRALRLRDEGQAGSPHLVEPVRPPS